MLGDRTPLLGKRLQLGVGDGEERDSVCGLPWTSVLGEADLKNRRGWILRKSLDAI